MAGPYVARYLDDPAPVPGEKRWLATGDVFVRRPSGHYEIVDRVKELVFREQKYKGRETGTATIFQGDLRISTNVADEQGRRAIGTRVSEEVKKETGQDDTEPVQALCRSIM